MDVRRFSTRAWMPCRKIPATMNSLVSFVGESVFFGSFLDSRLPWRSPFGPASLFACAPAHAVTIIKEMNSPKAKSF